MSALHRRQASLFLLLTGAIVGCGEEGPAGPPGGSLDPGTDAGTEDAAVGPDAGEDAGALPDTDGGTGEVPSCSLEPDQLRVQVDARGSHTWDAIQVGDAMHLAYQVSACADTPALQAQQIEYLTFASSGAFPEAEKVANYAEGTCFPTRTPTLGAKGENITLYYSATNSGTNELWATQLGSELGASRITMDPDSVRDQETYTSVAAFGAADLIAYVNAVPTIGNSPDACEVVTRRAATEESVIVAQADGFFVRGLELKPFGAESELGGVLGYIASLGEVSTIQLQLLDKMGKASGAPVELSDQVSAFSNVAVAMLPDGTDITYAGAVVYGVGPDDLHTELRFRTLGHDGSLGAERKITSGNRNAQGVGITPFGDGYALSFRAINGADSSIQVKFVNKTGDSAAHAELRMVESLTSGSPTRVFVTNDGRISVVFADQNGDGMFLRVARGICDP